MIICPNLSNKEVAQEFDELKSALMAADPKHGEAMAYQVWSLNNGNAIDKAPNGAESKLFQTLLQEFNGDRVKAIQAKAKIYGKSFIDWFGDWTKSTNYQKTSKDDAWNSAKEIYANSDEPYKDLADKVFDLCKNIGIGLYSTDKLQPYVAGDFYLEDQSVRISKNYRSALKDSNATLAQTILHEAIHAITAYAINNPEVLSTEEAKDAVKVIEACYERLKVEDLDSFQYYGLKNSKEMIAELANPEFRKLLKKYSLFDKIIVAIKTILDDLFNTNFTTNNETLEGSLLKSLNALINSFDKTAFNQSVEITLALRNLRDNHNSTIRLEDFKEYIEPILESAEDGDIVKFDVPNRVAEYIQPTSVEKYEVLALFIKKGNSTVTMMPWQLISSKKSTKDGFRTYEFKVGNVKQLALEQYRKDNSVNSVSKVVDENGEPLVVYHATRRDFTTFKMDSPGRVFENIREPFGHVGSFESANKIRGNKLVLFTSLKNPLLIPDFVHQTVPTMLKELYKQGIITEKESKKTDISNQELRDLLYSKGYDSIMYENKAEIGGISYGFINPNQIKSATGNIGIYSKEYNEIDDSESPLGNIMSADAEFYGYGSLFERLRQLGEQLRKKCKGE